MYEHVRPIVDVAEKTAATDTVNAALAVLRGLSLEEFGQLLLSMPNPLYPCLSDALPRMASEDAQKAWTGGSGEGLLRLSTMFARELETLYMRSTGRSIGGAKILDFGCGYGRILRLMYYFTDPENIYAVDAWQRSIDICKEDGLLGHLKLSESRPQELPVDGVTFDVAYAFSVFTHLPEATVPISLAALRKCINPDGVLVLTIRPLEFWQFRDSYSKTNVATTMEAAHRDTGFAYIPRHPVKAENGDTSMTLDYLDRFSDWRRVAHEFSSLDPYQIIVALRPC